MMIEDKLIHFLLSFIVAVVITGLVRDPLDLAVIALFCLGGIGFEFYQEHTGTGVFEVADMVANCLGALVGFVLVKESIRLRRWWRDRKYYK